MSPTLARWVRLFLTLYTGLALGYALEAVNADPWSVCACLLPLYLTWRLSLRLRLVERG